MKIKFTAGSSSDGNGREVTISSGRASRNRSFDGKSIRLDPMGIRFDNYTNNPILLWMHNSYMPPIGKAEIFRSGGVLKARLSFHGKTELSSLVEELWDDGFLSAVSVRVNLSNDDERHLIQDGDTLTIPKSDLVELSVVTTPADAGAHNKSSLEKYSVKFSSDTIRIVEDILMSDVIGDEVETLDDVDVSLDTGSESVDQAVDDMVFEFDEESIEQLSSALSVDDIIQRLGELEDKVRELEGEPVVTQSVRRARFSVQDRVPSNLERPKRANQSRQPKMKSASTFIRRSSRK